MLTGVALAFGFFELLLRTNDEERISKELERLQLLNALLIKAGYAEYLFEDFAESSFEVLRMLKKQVAESKNAPEDTSLVTVFNDQGESDAIITHFKVRLNA